MCDIFNQIINSPQFYSDSLSSVFGGGIGALIGGLFVYWATKVTLKSSSEQIGQEFKMELEAIKKAKLYALKIEVDANWNSLQLMRSKDENERLQHKDFPIYLLDTAWQDARNIVGALDKENVEKVMAAYVHIKQINTLIEWKIAQRYGDGTEISNCLFAAIKQVEKSLLIAKDCLKNII